jgi:hypothetical protein
MQFMKAYKQDGLLNFEICPDEECAGLSRDGGDPVAEDELLVLQLHHLSHAVMAYPAEPPWQHWPTTDAPALKAWLREDGQLDRTIVRKAEFDTEIFKWQLQCKQSALSVLQAEAARNEIEQLPHLLG